MDPETRDAASTDRTGDGGAAGADFPPPPDLSGRKPGTDVERVLSVDFGHKNLSYLIADVTARAASRKADREAIWLPPHLLARGRSRAPKAMDSAATEEEMLAEHPLQFYVTGTAMAIRPLLWRRVDLTAVCTGEAVVVAEADDSTSLSNITIHTTLMFLKMNGHLEALRRAVRRWKPTMVVFEQQFGPTRHNRGNPRMFALSNAMWLWFIDQFPQFERRPPAQQGPSASMVTCDLIQTGPTWRAMRAPTMLRKDVKRRRPPPAFKKKQVVHVVTQLVEFYGSCYAPLLELAAGKGDDLADVLIQIVSFWRCHRGAALKKDLRANRITPHDPRIQIPGLRAMGRTASAAAHNAHGGAGGPAETPFLPPPSADGSSSSPAAGYSSAAFVGDDGAAPSPLAKRPKPATTDGPDGEHPGTTGEEATEDGAGTTPGSAEEFVTYLLASAGANRTYVGSTSDVARRLRQHNGQLSGGAKETSVTQDWEVACVVRGFSSLALARSFEHALHHKRVPRGMLIPVKLKRKHSRLPHLTRRLALALESPRWRDVRTRVDWRWDSGSMLPDAVRRRLEWQRRRLGWLG